MATYSWLIELALVADARGGLSYGETFIDSLGVPKRFSFFRCLLLPSWEGIKSSCEFEIILGATEKLGTSRLQRNRWEGQPTSRF